MVLTRDDFLKNRQFSDRCFPCSWGIDLHTPEPSYGKGQKGEEFISRATGGKGYTYKGPYWAPYRCLYSRNIQNLFMAGRDISVTHEALGPVRVMKTCGMMGEVVGMAAALCKQFDCTPREIYGKHLDALKQLLMRGAGSKEPAVPLSSRAEDNDSADADLDISAMIQPIPRSATFRDPQYDIWCGSMIKGDDGKYHLFYSRWPRKLGHSAWVTNSEVAHAVADHPLGPYKHSDVTLPPRGKEFWDGSCTHNPTVIRSRGKYYLYYVGNTGDGSFWSNRNNQRIGVAVADKPEGPWQRFDKPVLDVSADHDALDARNGL